jgi:hypothetical protein
METLSEVLTLAEAKKCKVEGCKRPYRAKGYCVTHYKKWRRGEMGDARFRRCFAKECKEKEAARGLCQKHLDEKYGGKKTAVPEAVPAAPAAPAPAAPEAPAAQ